MLYPASYTMTAGTFPVPRDPEKDKWMNRITLIFAHQKRIACWCNQSTNHSIIIIIILLLYYCVKTAWKSTDTKKNSQSPVEWFELAEAYQTVSALTCHLIFS